MPGIAPGIEHDVKNLAIVSEQFGELVLDKLGLLRRHPALPRIAGNPLGTVTDRVIQPDPDALLAKRLRELANNVPLASLRYRVSGVLAGPQAEPVVMLGGQDGEFHPGALSGIRPLAAIQFYRIQQRRT